MADTVSNGEHIQQMRERLHWTRRRLGSKLGLTLRKMRAIETDTEPKPKLEKRVYSMKFIEFLGYTVHVYNDWPVKDKSFDLQSEQSRAIHFLEKVR